MARYTGPKEKIERALGQKLFLKGERSSSPKAALVKKPYPPGIHGRRKRKRLSEYGMQLQSKQRVKNTYKVLEKQFRRYVTDAMRSRGNSGDILITHLEQRLDNVVYRLGFASARDTARQLVTHGHFLVNDKPVNIPSYMTKPGDTIQLREHKKRTSYATQILPQLQKDLDTPSWLNIDKTKLIGHIKAMPDVAESGIEARDIQNIIELYSR